MIYALCALSLAAPLDAIKRAEWSRDMHALKSLPFGDDAETLAQLAALGRLRDARFLPKILALQAHPSERIKARAAFALGLTPGSAPTIRAWLTELPKITDKNERLFSEFGLRWQLVEALGRQGDASDVSTLIALTREDWPIDEAAIRALLRLHRSGIDIQHARASVARRLVDSDPRSAEAAGQLLARTGVKDLDLDLNWLLWATKTAPTSSLQANLIRSFDGTTYTEDAIAIGRLRGALPKIAALNRMTKSVHDLALIKRSFSHPSQGVRLAAIRAAGRVDATLINVSPSSVVEQAAVVLARHDAQKDVSDASIPWQVRAASLSSITHVPTLEKLALTGNHPGIRVAAATRLDELGAGRDVAMKLLQSSDAAIREIAIEGLKGEPNPKVLEELLLAVRVESNEEVLRAGLERLKQFRDIAPQAVPASRYLVSALKRASRAHSPPVRRIATELAQHLKITLPAADPLTEERELILPDGTIVTTTGGLPTLSEVDRYTSATILTTRGAITVQLRPDIAPLAVHNFARLAYSGFYSGLSWHRVVPGFVAQAGCPRGDGWGGPGWTIVDEVSDRPFTAGALGMARGERDTGGSQFFLMTGAARFLDGDYTWFGEVTTGQDVLSTLTPDDTIQSITIQQHDP